MTDYFLFIENINEDIVRIFGRLTNGNEVYVLTEIKLINSVIAIQCKLKKTL